MTRKSYRPRDSYLSKDPEKRANQLANLKSVNRGRPKGTGSAGGKRPDQWGDDVISFAENHFILPETKKPVVLLEWEKKIFRDLFDAVVLPTLALLGMCKKSGKSTIAAIDMSLPNKTPASAMPAKMNVISPPIKSEININGVKAMIRVRNESINPFLTPILT